MIEKSRVTELAERHLAGGPLFPVEIRVKAGNRITVFIDGDHGVTVEDCRSLNLFLNEALDRDREDFDLTVSSAGADRPLVLPRQFAGNVGRSLEVVTRAGDKLTGTLLSAGSEGIELQTLPAGKRPKGEQPVTRTVSLTYGEIGKAIVIINI